MTPPKQMKIPMTSIRWTRSLSKQHAKIEIQNGLLWKRTIAVPIGSMVADTANRPKVSWPKTDRITKSRIRSRGKFLNGFFRLYSTWTPEIPKIHTFLKNVNSMTGSASNYLDTNLNKIAYTV